MALRNKQKIANKLQKQIKLKIFRINYYYNKSLLDYFSLIFFVFVQWSMLRSVNERACDYKRFEGNILHCTKRTQNKTKIVQWRLLYKKKQSNQENWIFLYIQGIILDRWECCWVDEFAKHIKNCLLQSKIKLEKFNHTHL